MSRSFDRPTALDRVARLATTYDDAREGVTEETSEEFVIPEDFSGLSDDQITELHSEAVSLFDATYGDGSDLSEETLETLAQLTEGIETLQAEVTSRSEARAERDARAAELAARVNPEAQLGAETETPDGEEEEAEGEAEDEDEDEEGEGDDGTSDESAAETIVASAKKRQPIRVPLNSVRRNASQKNYAHTSNASAPRGMADVAFDGDGKGVDWNGLATGLDRQLASFNVNQYAMAAKRNQAIREQRNLATFQKQFNDDLVVKSGDIGHIDAVMNRAVDQSQLKGGSLVAAGGWGAPSETLYDFLELEQRDGLISVPEIGISRGGISFTQGPRFQDIFDNAGFDFTEADDIAGIYSEEGGEFAGNKPTYRPEVPEFNELRLDVVGLSVTAGILLSRGYPEIIERTIRGALIAHEHKYAAATISRMVEGSDAVTMPTPQVGAAAPILNSIELQMEHYRYVHRMSPNASLEAIFPRWALPAIRSDLARQRGVDTKAVTDQQITGWFGARGATVQFVYNWQNLTGDAAGFTQWPTEVQFLLYAAGTWVRGTSDIITLDTVYDSVNLAQNDYIALFTEEGLLMAKRGHDSRVVTVPLEVSGTSAGTVLINHNGTPAVEAGGGDDA